MQTYHTPQPRPIAVDAIVCPLIIVKRAKMFNIVPAEGVGIYWRSLITLRPVRLYWSTIDNELYVFHEAPAGSLRRATSTSARVTRKFDKNRESMHARRPSASKVKVIFTSIQATTLFTDWQTRQPPIARVNLDFCFGTRNNPF